MVNQLRPAGLLDECRNFLAIHWRFSVHDVLITYFYTMCGSHIFFINVLDVSLVKTSRGTARYMKHTIVFR